MKNRLSINLTAGIFVFAIQIIINFFLSPYIISSLGNEAYGFIGLGGNFIMYLSVVTITINSVVARFVSLEFHKGNYKKANEYYSSVFIIDIILSCFIGIVSFVIIINLNYLIKIPQHLLQDVKILFSLFFLNFIIATLTTVYSISTFTKNRLDISAVRNLVSHIIEAVVLVGLFYFFKPKIYYVGISVIACSLYMFGANFAITKKLTPELSFLFSDFSFSHIKELLKSGIWNAFNSLNAIFLTGLDLLLVNIFLGANSMGILAISKIIPAYCGQFVAIVANVFSPSFVELYSKNKIEELVKEAKFSMTFVAFFTSVPIAVFGVMGVYFFSLWLPNKPIEEIRLIYILSMIGFLPLLFSSFARTLYSIDMVTNKLKRPVIVGVIKSLATFLSQLAAFNFFNLGLYGVVIIGSFFWILEIFIFTPLNAAYNLDIKWNTFYGIFFKNVFVFFIVWGILFFVLRFFKVNNWFDFFGVSAILMIFGYLAMFCLLLSNAQKTALITKIKTKIKKA